MRKYVVAVQLDAFLTAYSGGWVHATPDDVAGWFSFLGSQGRGTELVHDVACPAVGSLRRDRCPPGAACSTRYAAGSLRMGLFLQVEDDSQAYKEQLGLDEE